MKRYSSIDALKALATFFVVFIHSPIPGVLGSIFEPITRIAVPLFFMVSGFFMWDTDKLLGEKVIKQIKKIFSLAVISNLLYFVCDLTIQIINNTSILDYFKNVFTISNTIKLLFFNQTQFAVHLWFLSALLYVLIIYYYIIKFKIYKICIRLIPVLLLCGFIFGKYSIIIFHREFSLLISRNFLFVGLPYFLLGNIIRKRVEKKDMNKNNSIVFLIGCVIFSLTSIIEKYLLININANASGDHYISTILLTVITFIYFVNNPMLYKNSILEKIGKNHSLFIYIVHPFIILILKLSVVISIEKHVTLYIYFTVFLVYFLSLSCSVMYLKFKQIIAVKDYGG